MPTAQSEIYALSFHSNRARTIIEALIQSPFLYEFLNPLELGSNWGTFFFSQYTQKNSSQQEVITKALQYIQPKTWWQRQFQPIINITSEDVFLASQTDDYILDLCEKLVQFHEIRELFKTNKNQSLREYNELEEYFDLRGVNPIHIQPEHSKKIIALYFLAIRQHNITSALNLIFSTNPATSTCFLFLAVHSSAAIIFEDFLNNQNILYEPSQWVEDIWEIPEKNWFQKLIPFSGNTSTMRTLKPYKNLLPSPSFIRLEL